MRGSKTEAKAADWEAGLTAGPAAHDSGRPKLLIVDDDAGPRNSLKIIFQDDYEVFTAASGEEALDIIKQHTINAAILDIRMSGMSGIDLLGQIRTQDSDIAVIMLTAYETVETARQALRLGACDYLTKPFDLLTMRAAVAKAVERNRCARRFRANEEVLKQIQSQLHEYQVREEMARKQGEIYSMVLHDINNPLTVISGLAVMANERLRRLQVPYTQDLASVREDLSQIEQQVFKCLEVSRRYLGFARRRPGETPVVNVNRVLEDLRTLLRPNPLLEGHELLLEPPPMEIFALINGTDLIQILLNLVINALQATDMPHQVRIAAQLIQQPVPPALMQEANHACFACRLAFQNQPPLVEIRVADNGPGIATVPIKRIFEAYYTTKQAGKGTGLGLTIVQHLLEQAHGGLRVESQPGLGTTFTLWIPAR
jgi:signal transduction histidine kinase